MSTDLQIWSDFDRVQAKIENIKKSWKNYNIPKCKRRHERYAKLKVLCTMLCAAEDEEKSQKIMLDTLKQIDFMATGEFEYVSIIEMLASEISERSDASFLEKVHERLQKKGGTADDD